MTRWNTTDAYAMAKRILDAGMTFDADDTRLIRRGADEPEATFNVYDLHRLNLLCWMAEGFIRGRDAALDRAAKAEQELSRVREERRIAIAMGDKFGEILERIGVLIGWPNGIHETLLPAVEKYVAENTEMRAALVGYADAFDATQRVVGVQTAAAYEEKCLRRSDALVEVLRVGRELQGANP